MAIVNKPDMNYGIWAENGNIEIPSSEKVGEGWVIEKPLNEQMNWLQNRSDKMLQYLNQRGLPEWDFRTDYPKDSYVVRSGVLYQAVVQNTDKDPSENISLWKKPFALSGVADEAGSEIEKIKNQDGYLAHYVRKSAPVMSAKTLGVSYADSTGKGEYKFVGSVPTISNNGSVVAEFSGGTKPKDVVTHEQIGQLLQSYKVGDIYITTNSQNPSASLGYGTWDRFGEGEVLVGFSTSVDNRTPQWVKTAGTKFGSYTHKLTVEEMPSHTHDIRINAGNSIGNYPEDTAADAQFYIAKTEPTGGDQPHNIVQPSVVVYMWKRVA